MKGKTKCISLPQDRVIKTEAFRTISEKMFKSLMIKSNKVKPKEENNESKQGPDPSNQPQQSTRQVCYLHT